MKWLTPYQASNSALDLYCSLSLTRELTSDQPTTEVSLKSFKHTTETWYLHNRKGEKITVNHLDSINTTTIELSCIQKIALIWQGFCCPICSEDMEKYLLGLQQWEAYDFQHLSGQNTHVYKIEWQWLKQLQFCIADKPSSILTFDKHFGFLLLLAC